MATPLDRMSPFSFLSGILFPQYRSRSYLCCQLGDVDYNRKKKWLIATNKLLLQGKGKVVGQRPGQACTGAM